MFGGKHNRLALTVALAGLPVSALAQSITTLPPNNGNGGIFLQITPTSSTLRVESVAMYYSFAAGAPVTVQVWTRPGPYTGFTGGSAGWVLSETVTGTSAGPNVLAGSITLTNPISCPAGGSTSIYFQDITTGGGLRYQGIGTVFTTTFVNADLTLFSDVGRNSSVAFGGSQNSPRAFAGTLNYSIGGLTGRCCRTDGSCVITSAAHCAAQSGVYGGDGTTCSPNVCTQPATGRCCFELGTCLVLSAANCAAQGGSYAGNGTTCSTNCPKPGACCLPDGSCVILTNAKCTAATTAGIYRGNGTLCGTVSPRCWPAPTLWNNGPMSTGATTQSGLAAPAGSTWSEMSNDTGQNTVSNSVQAWFVSPHPTLGQFRIADNFTISNLNGWHIDKVIIPGIQESNPPLTSSTITGATLRIWNGPPGDAGSVVVWGDTTTNLLSATSVANIYRCFNSTVPWVCGNAPLDPNLTKPVMWAELSVNTNLPAGTYWLDWDLTASPRCSAQPVAIKGLRAPTLHGDGRQARDSAWSVWQETVDPGQGCTPGSVGQDFPFEIRGYVWCYANCDNSTGEPRLTPNDFQCFLNRFAANAIYANCDRSTGTPTLTPNDFQCFLDAYAAGCS